MTYYILYRLSGAPENPTYTYYVIDTEGNMSYGHSSVAKAIQEYNSPLGVLSVSTEGLHKQPITEKSFYKNKLGDSFYLIAEVANLYEIRDTHPELFI